MRAVLLNVRPAHKVLQGRRDHKVSKVRKVLKGLRDPKGK
jgi:hypothetical protein